MRGRGDVDKVTHVGYVGLNSKFKSHSKASSNGPNNVMGHMVDRPVIKK